MYSSLYFTEYPTVFTCLVFSVLNSDRTAFISPLHPFPGTWSSWWILSILHRGMLYPSIKLTSPSTLWGDYSLFSVSPDRWGLCYAWQPSHYKYFKGHCNHLWLPPSLSVGLSHRSLMIQITGSLNPCCCCWIQVFVALFNITISFSFSWLSMSRPFFCCDEGCDRN